MSVCAVCLFEYYLLRCRGAVSSERGVPVMLNSPLILSGEGRPTERLRGVTNQLENDSVVFSVVKRACQDYGNEPKCVK